MIKFVFLLLLVKLNYFVTRADFDSEEDEDVEFLLFTRDNLLTPTVITEENLHLIDKNLSTKCIIHGGEQTPESGWIRNAITDYLNKSAYNILVIDWSSQDVITEFDLEEIGITFGEFIFTLITAMEHPLPKFHFIGYSLGAHIGGIGARTIRNLTKGQKVSRISAINPARFELSRDLRLTKNDAHCIDAVHTDDVDYTPFAYLNFQIDDGICPPMHLLRKINVKAKRLAECPRVYWMQIHSSNKFGRKSFTHDGFIFQICCDGRTKRNEPNGIIKSDCEWIVNC